ncbi:MAG: DUF1573 domain-containing protein [Candidatus Methylomirabilales bacterium]
MRHVWLIGTVVLLGTFVLAGCGGGQPDITVASTRHDFGPVKQGQVATADIAVRNTGKGDLKIESVSTSCGCTSARVQPDVIPAGGEGRLIIRYDSGVHPDRGPVQRHIYIASNDPDEAEVEVIITADVQPPAQ